MGYVELIKVTPDQLDTCDQCNQQGLITSGKFIEHNQENVCLLYTSPSPRD